MKNAGKTNTAEAAFAITELVEVGNVFTKMAPGFPVPIVIIKDNVNQTLAIKKQTNVIKKI